MIPLFKPDLTRNLVTFGGLSFNNPADPPDDIFELNTVVTTPAYDTSIDSSPVKDGAILTPAKRIYLLARLDGILRAPTLAKAYDKRALLMAATDPAWASLASPATSGVAAVDFSVPTLDLGNWGTGFIPSRYMARAKMAALVPDSQFTGFAGAFSVELLIPDARRIAQTQSSRVGAGTAVNLGNTLAGLQLSIAMAGAGASNYTISRDAVTTGAKSLVLNLSTRSGGQTVTVDMDTQEIKVNGVVTTGIYVSGDFFSLDPGTTTLSIANTTNATTTSTWRHSWIA